MMSSRRSKIKKRVLDKIAESALVRVLIGTSAGTIQGIILLVLLGYWA